MSTSLAGISISDPATMTSLAHVWGRHSHEWNTGSLGLNNVNEAPAFAGSSTTRKVAENSPAATNVGDPITATDPDGDTLAYSLSGTDAASFVIGAITGQIVTKAGVTYDYETKSSYSLTVDVSDSGGLTDSIAVTVNLNKWLKSRQRPVRPTWAL